MEEIKKIEYLVADTAAFIQNKSLQDLAEHVITCQKVIDEVKNKRQLKRLAILPYDLEVKDVFPENIKFVHDIAKQTGDYRSLSATDIEVIALTYQLEKEKVGTEHLKTKVEMQKSVTFINHSSVDFKNHKESTPPCVDALSLPDSESNLGESSSDGHQSNSKVDDIFVKVPTNVDQESSGEHSNGDSEGSEDSEDSNSDDDDEGWITPANLKQVKIDMDQLDYEDVNATVACITTDFAMQNVLKQIGLKVASLDGRIIKQIRTYIFRCYGCFKTTDDMTKVFCPSCGHNTLKRVSVTLEPDGTQKIHINVKRPLTMRGRRFKLPLFKGGKHSNNPIVTADQRVPDQKPTRVARTKTNILESDFIEGYSPFAMRDTTSRSAVLGIREQKQMRRPNLYKPRNKKKIN